MRFVQYVRVSTERQGQSGLGLEAQQAAIAQHVGNGVIVATFVEVESGRKNERPELAAALAKARETGAMLIVAKLDRLARDAAFIAEVMKSGVDFVCADNPHANRLTLHILAAVAEDEARRISERTRAALAAAKARGVKLGGTVTRDFSEAERARGAALRSAKAKARAGLILPVLDELKAAGMTTLRELADGLNGRGVAAPRGGSWSAVQISRVVSAM